MGFVFFDTESNGLPTYGRDNPADGAGQPRLASISMFFTDAGMNELSVFSQLIRPDGWEMTPEATAVNGLTTERLLKEGEPIANALKAFADAIEAGNGFFAYNAAHDLKIMRGELRRAGLPDRYEVTKRTCVMRAAQAHKIKNEGGRGAPSLIHCCNHFGVPLRKAHNSLDDAWLCLEVARHLNFIGALPEPSLPRIEAEAAS